MKDIYILVPSYNPDENTMDEFLKELKKEFKNILIINDGSINKMYFDKLKEEGYEIITNYVNLGKGRALKNGINYILNTYKKTEGIITYNKEGIRLKYDIYEDICFEKFFDNVYCDCKGNSRSTCCL